MATTFPYIARSSTEHPIDRRVRVTEGRLTYVDERPDDRDAQGILWARQIFDFGNGRPRYGLIHTARQRHAMLNLLCQVCGGDPDENDAGIRWLLPGPWPLDRPVSYPPICAACSAEATRRCPPLRASGYTLLRARDVEPAGVSGLQFDADGEKVSPEMAQFCYDDPRLPMVLAFDQLIWLCDTDIEQVVPPR